MKNNNQFVETLNAVDRRMQEARKQSDLILPAMPVTG